MFDRFFGSRNTAPSSSATLSRPATPPPSADGDTATVRRIVAKLEAMPLEQARLIASAAYTLARAANADLNISDEETAAIERELQANEALDEATAVLVTEMAKLQAKTVGGTEDYVVTRQFRWSPGSKTVSFWTLPSSSPEAWGMRATTDTPCSRATGKMAAPIPCSNRL